MENFVTGGRPPKQPDNPAPLLTAPAMEDNRATRFAAAMEQLQALRSKREQCKIETKELANFLARGEKEIGETDADIDSLEEEMLRTLETAPHNGFYGYLMDMD